jgi:hypothetical protein
LKSSIEGITLSLSGSTDGRREGREEEPAGGPVNVSALYALYRRGYAEYDRTSGAALLFGRGPLSPIQAVILEFAEEDARNGRPCRTPEEFARALSHGSDTLVALGLAA